MRHSPPRRSLLSAIGRSTRLADHTPERPRHGEAIRRPAPGQPHRALRLAMVVGLAGAGFCLVLAMIGAVVTIGGADPSNAAASPPTTRSGPGADSQSPSAGAPSTSANSKHYRAQGWPTVPVAWRTLPPRGGRSGPAGRPGRTRPGRFRIGKTIARYRGTGPARRNKFQVRKPGDWGISWNFSCPPHAGSFTIRAGNRMVTNSIEVSASGPEGHGMTWETRDPGAHSLMVITSCSWAVRVVLPMR